MSNDHFPLEKFRVPKLWSAPTSLVNEHRAPAKGHGLRGGWQKRGWDMKGQTTENNMPQKAARNMEKKEKRENKIAWYKAVLF